MHMPSLLYLLLFLSSLLSGCRDPDPARQQRKWLPSRNYHYVAVDFAGLARQERYYVPVYSDIYHQSGEQLFALTATLSIRNTSMRDSLYVGRVDYYDSQGQRQRQYLGQTIVLGPLSSVEFVVENREAEGGAGANFIVDWGTTGSRLQPIIQAVMIGTTSQQGISFAVDGVAIAADTSMAPLPD